MQKLPWSVITEYFQCIGMLQAQETGIGVQVSSYPHMKDTKRREYHKMLKRESTKHLEKPKRSVADAALELAKRLMGG